jgi:hypothetical protein
VTKILGTCPDCKGSGNVPHVRRTLLQDEAPNPNDLDRYKTEDTCWSCLGSGKRMIEVEITEPPKQSEGEPYCGC